MNEVITISGVDCYEENGTAYLKLEAVARGLGFTDNKDGIEYVRWARVDKYLKELNFATCGEAKNETAERFQALVADEIIPSIRKHGAYMTPETLEQAILNPEMMIKLCTALKDEQDKNKALQVVNSSLTVDNQIMKPKADYFDELVDRNLLTNFRDTAKQLHVGERKFIKFLLEKKYIYRDKRGKLKPYANKYEDLFDVKEFTNEKTGFCDTQTLITPKGRETFRLLLLKAGI